MSDEVKMASWFDEHHYKITKEGQEFYIPSVTTKLSIESKYALSRWRGDLGNREADLRMYEASNRGKRIHHSLNVFLLGGPVVYNPWEAPLYSEEEIKNMASNANGIYFVLKAQDEMMDVWKLQQFFDVVKPKIIASEQIVYSIEDDIAGTLDVALFIEKGTYPVNGSKGLVVPESGIYIGDLKTGKTVDTSYWNQLAAYQCAYEKKEKQKTSGCLILHTGSTMRSGIPGFSALLKDSVTMKAERHLETFFDISKVWKARNPNDGPTAFKFPSLIQRRK